MCLHTVVFHNVFESTEFVNNSNHVASLSLCMIMLLPVVCNTEISNNHDAASDLKANAESLQVQAIKVDVDRISAMAPQLLLKWLTVSVSTNVVSAKFLLRP